MFTAALNYATDGAILWQCQATVIGQHWTAPEVIMQQVQ